MALDVNIGDHLVFDVSFEYQGPYYDKAKIYTTIGHTVLGVYDEILVKEHTLIVPETPSWEPLSKRVLMQITDKLEAGRTYDLMVKLLNAPGTWTEWRLSDAIYVIEAFPPTEFRNLEVTVSRG